MQQAIGIEKVILRKAGRKFCVCVYVLCFFCTWGKWIDEELMKCSSRARYESVGTESVRRLAERGSNWRPAKADGVVN